MIVVLLETRLGKRKNQMKRPGFSKKGQSAIEYVAVLMFILIALFVFQKYLSRGISGRWKLSMDVLGQERVYDPNITTECAYDIFAHHNTNGSAQRWYDVECYNERCKATCYTAEYSWESCFPAGSIMDDLERLGIFILWGVPGPGPGTDCVLNVATSLAEKCSSCITSAGCATRECN